MVPIEVKTKKGKQMMQVDEHARPQTTLEQLNKLPPVFKKEGTVTAGNASVGGTYLELSNSSYCIQCRVIVRCLLDTFHTSL